MLRLWAAGACGGQPAGWAIVWARFQSVQGAGLEVVPGRVLCVIADAPAVPCGGEDGEACVQSVVLGEER